MTVWALARSESEGEGYVPPGAGDFELPPLFTVAGLEVTKPIVLLLSSAALIGAFFYLAARRGALVPGRLQFAGEGAYNLVRNGLGRDIIGSHDFKKFVPFLLTLFFFILVNNIFGIIPFIQFPTMSHIGFPIALAVLSFLIYNIVGIRTHGFRKYFKDAMFPPGVPKAVYVILTPIELMTILFTRPVTLAMRLFANMFAGHLLLLVFILGGQYMLQSGGLAAFLSPFAFAMGIVLTFFELLVQVLQAYIFTLLSSLYISGALAEEH
ncbi:MAG: F0F1 ATP synthase subunit A [Sporichthyaceae bacterium]|nr:F0F1 ATP synthase subunit A [Sporichthyaceae bacterium]